MDELRTEFIAETRETLEQLTGQLVRWEQQPDDKALVAEVFRFVHTVKGSCGFLDLPRLLRLSDAAEEVLSAARDGELVVTTALVSATLDVIDRISELTNALESGAAVADDDAGLIERLHKCLMGEEVETAIEPRGAAAVNTNSKGTIRVTSALLDKVMSGVSDLVLARNELSRQLHKIDAAHDVSLAFDRLSANIAEIRDVIGLMRMQHVDRLFSKLPRLIRDTSVQLGKQVSLTIDGGDVEIDREMAEALRDPMTHILRNAVDHGIELPDERIAAGKHPTGKISVWARQAGNQIIIEIADDGRGIDVEQIGSRAIAQKLVTFAHWQQMTERARLEMIFAPGFSTRDSVSSVSGRGVGMDVVKSNVRAIGGLIEIENRKGEGMKIMLQIPMTLSIVAGLTVSAGGEFFGINRASVVEILSVSNPNLVVEELGGTPVANVRGTRFALAKLENLLALPANEKADRNIILLRPAIGGVFALEVDAVTDHAELVVKPMPPLASVSKHYNGVTLPDNGRPMLMLDASGLAANVDMGCENIETLDGSSDGAISAQCEAALAYKATDGKMRAIRLSVVDRVEEFSTTEIKDLAARVCIAVDGELIDIVEFVRAAVPSTQKMLRLTDGNSAKYLAVSNVFEMFELPPNLAPSAQPDKVEAIVHFDGQPLELVNAYHFFESATNAKMNGEICFVESDGADGWEQQILGPLLIASGYRVSFDPVDREHAAVLLSSAKDIAVADSRMVRLRSEVQCAAGSGQSIYRYDRLGLLAAIDAKLGEAA